MGQNVKTKSIVRRGGSKVIFENKIVSNIKTIDNRVIKFEHDSSEEAWEHYKIIYFDKDGGSRINADYSLNNEFPNPVLSNYRNKKYYDEPTQNWPYVNRYYLLSKDSIYHKETKNYSGERANLSGDCDFNFNAKKYSIFENIIKKEYKNYPRIRKYALNVLEECKKMHHSLVNFSLMQTKGNMQGFKGSCLNNGVYFSLDRADTFVSYLAKYYQLEQCQKQDSFILVNAKNNKETLQDYLDSFTGGIYEYCKKVYLIDDKKFVDRMIKEGSMIIETGSDVIRYMLLALEFWDKKELKIKEIYREIA